MRGATALAALAAARRLLAEQLVAASRRPSIAERPAGAAASALSSSSLVTFRPRHQWWRGAAHETTTTSSSPEHTCGPSCDHHHHETTTSANANADAKAASLEQQEATCWSCNHATRRGGVVCQGCDRIQPLDSQALTYYELFGYGDEGENEDEDEGAKRRRSEKQKAARRLRHPRYRLDARDLERRYRELQWALHPDRLTGPGREVREVQHGAAAAALVNQAYGVLRSPLARANYLLMLRRLPPEARDPAADPAARRAAEQRAAARLVEEEERRTAVDPGLLMEVMEARERVEEADDPAELRSMLAGNREAQARLVEQLGAALDGEEEEEGVEGGGGDNVDDDDAHTQRAQELAARLSYLVRIQQAIEAKL